MSAQAPYLLSVTLNPAVDHQIFVQSLALHDTNRVARTEIDAGGKGVNLSRVYAELGGDTVATGFLGGSAGAVVRRVLALQGVVDRFVEIAGETRTNISIEDESGEPPTTFNHRGPMISPPEMAELEQTVLSLADGAGWVCMGGSLCQGVGADAYRRLTELARSKGCRVLVDADGEAAREGLKAHPDFIKPNAAEAERLVGHPVETTEDAIRAADTLFAELACGCESPIVVISRGKDGAVLRSKQGVYVGRSAPVEARSTIGSGDSFLGGMLWAMDEGMPMLECFRWGLAAGAATATTDGTEIARRGVTELLYGHTRVEQAR